MPLKIVKNDPCSKFRKSLQTKTKRLTYENSKYNCKLFTHIVSICITNSTFAPWFIYFVTQWFKLTFYPNKRKKTLLIFLISTSNHMFKRQIWDKFTEFTFLSETREISKFQKMNEINFSQISRINM